MVAVSDTGSGMSQETIAQAFDPFFTTKDVGKGSGLGLSQVYGFMKTAGGHSHIYSEVGIGTTVKLYFPKSADAVAPVDPPSLQAAARPKTAMESVLVVEDDPDVLEIAVEGLSALGYHVSTAINARQALEIIRSDQPIDILFSDVVMPGGMNGVQLAVEARRLRPQLKVLLTSGYTASALAVEHGVPPGLEVIGKPYKGDDLANKLRLVINS
jgi:CheY-like chemotaxis protein